MEFGLSRSLWSPGGKRQVFRFPPGAQQTESENLAHRTDSENGDRWFHHTDVRTTRLSRRAQGPPEVFCDVSTERNEADLANRAAFGKPVLNGLNDDATRRVRRIAVDPRRDGRQRNRGCSEGI